MFKKKIRRKFEKVVKTNSVNLKEFLQNLKNIQEFRKEDFT